MDWLVQIFNWVANNEAVLSGIAAVIAIIAVVFALTYRAFRLWRGYKRKSTKNLLFHERLLPIYPM